MKSPSSPSVLNSFRLRKIKRLTKKIISLESHYLVLSDEELQAQTGLFRERLEKGVKLDKLLVEAYAVVREASYRVLGKRPYPVQVMGGDCLAPRHYCRDENRGREDFDGYHAPLSQWFDWKRCYFSNDQ